MATLHPSGERRIGFQPSSHALEIISLFSGRRSRQEEPLRQVLAAQAAVSDREAVVGGGSLLFERLGQHEGVDRFHCPAVGQRLASGLELILPEFGHHGVLGTDSAARTP